MTDLMKLTPPRFGTGPVSGPELEKAFARLYREVLARQDVRYPNNDFNAGLVAKGTGVTLGPQASPAGRTGNIPTMLAQITDAGTAQDQRFLPQVSAGNVLSVQSTVPLSATADAVQATISVASHTVQYGFGKVAYNTGTISGLPTSTQHYVYADDPGFAGGAVSYLATTTPQDVVANNGRYYVGSIMTPVSASTASIAGATSANPIVFQTGAAHGFNTNDSVQLASLPGDFGTHLNSLTETITVTDGTHFSIPVDGTTYAAYTSGGTATRQSAGTTGAGGAGGGGGSGGPLR